MRYLKPLSFLSLIMSFCLVCCNKTKISPTGGGSSTDSTTGMTSGLHMNLSLLFKQATIDTNHLTNYELFVSDPAGKMLYDTLANFNVQFAATLQTTASLVDVSIIYLNSPTGGTPYYTVNTYKSVNPATWKDLPLSDSALGVATPAVTGTGTITYSNIPLSSYLWQFMSNANNSPASSPQDVSNSNQVVVTYPYEGDPYAYMAFPYNGLYNLHKIRGMNDSVDLSTLDTAVELSFNWPSYYNLNILLYGYLDSTNLSQPLLLAPGHGDYTHNYTYEAMYPSKHEFQKYDLLLTGNPAVFDQSLSLQATIRWTDLNTIPLNIPFPDQTYFTVNSSTPDNFSVGFPLVKPTYYMLATQFGTGSNFNITASGDSTALDPEKTIVMLIQGKLLNGQNPAMYINGFIMALDQQPDYQTYMTTQADASKAYTRPLSNQVSLAVGLGGGGGAFTTKFSRQLSMPSRNRY
jgi:hypothetical protein